jgi:Dolichyl-phosphate-mannose-protein mannosyltransferase
MAALVLCAIAVRLWLILGYGPGFVGFGDSHEYVVAAARGVFGDAQKPAGYPLFLWALHHFSNRLTFTIAVQHVLGLATGFLLYNAVRRAGAAAWLGLLPAAIVFFGGTGLLLEHSLLADSLFAFVQALGVYLAIRSLNEPRLRWPLAAGLTIGISFWIKTVGLSSVVLIPPLLLLAAPGTLSRRALSAASAVGAALVLIVGYPAVQALVTGHWRYERQGAWNLYGRVATFVDCSRFTPPAGTRFLCPAEPLADRQSQSFYQYARSAPAVRRYGGPAHAPPYANAVLQRFSGAAIEQEPAAYATAIARGLTFFISPRPGEGYTPGSIRKALLDPKGVASIEPALAGYYPRDRGYRGTSRATQPLATYERTTRLQGPLLIVLLLAAVFGAPLLPGRLRVGAVLFTATALLSAILADAGNGYDARYAYPAFGPLAAGAALGAWGIATRFRRRTRHVRGR